MSDITCPCIILVGSECSCPISGSSIITVLIINQLSWNHNLYPFFYQAQQQPIYITIKFIQPRPLNTIGLAYSFMTTDSVEYLFIFIDSSVNSLWLPTG